MPTTADVEKGIESFLDASYADDDSVEDSAENETESSTPLDEVDEVDEPEEAPEDETESEDTTDDAIESLSDLAEALGMSQDDLLKTIRGKVKVNGEERDVTIADMVAGFQKGEAYEERKAKLQQEREAFESEATKAREYLSQQITQTNRMGQLLQAQLVGEVNSPQMQKLRTENPGEYAARMQELNKRSQDLQQALAWQNQQIEAQQEQLREKENEQRTQSLQREMELLSEKLPDFDRDATISYMKENGFTEAQMDIDNHLWLVVLDKARKFDQQAKAGDVAAKKVKTLPKLVKPGKQKTVSKSQVSELKSRLKKTGKGTDFAKLIEHQLNRGML